ncbi:MAG: VWA domain-containing protein [Gammaproteobacteria bacterium]
MNRSVDHRHFPFVHAWARARRQLPILLVALLGLCSAGLWAQPAGGKTGIDAVLLMDSSGSMRWTDPKKLRVPAARLFMSLLGPEDRVGLVSFSDAGYPVQFLTPLEGEAEDKALASTDRISSRGVFTNLHAALLKGQEMLQRREDKQREQILILMTDGLMDVGDDLEEERLGGLVVGETLDQLKADGIKVYTIAFTEGSDQVMLQQLADGTGGLYRLARTDRDLHEVFSAIFESAKAPDMLPMEGGEFMVDGSIKEVTIVASKERADVSIFLETPSGKQVSTEDAGDELKWFISEHFDMITLRKPEQGRWKLLFSAGNNRAYIVTNLSMGTNLRGGEVPAGSQTAIESWLERDGERVTTEAMLSNTEFLIEITEPDGVVSDIFPMLDLGEVGDREAGDGIHTNLLTFRKPGDHNLRVIARSPTFERSRSAYFKVLAPPAEALPEPEPEPVTEPEPVPEPEAGEPTPQLEEEVLIEEPQEEGSSLGMILGVFFGVNLLLALVGGGVWWFLARRKKKAAAAATQGEDGDEDEDEVEDRK